MALASLTPNWQRMDRNWRSNRWGFFSPDRRVSELIMALNGGMYLLQQAYPGLVLKLARVGPRVPRAQPSRPAAWCRCLLPAACGDCRPCPPWGSVLMAACVLACAWLTPARACSRGRRPARPPTFQAC
jgi:hypothetical protein